MCQRGSELLLQAKRASARTDSALSVLSTTTIIAFLLGILVRFTWSISSWTKVEIEMFMWTAAAMIQKERNERNTSLKWNTFEQDVKTACNLHVFQLTEWNQPKLNKACHVHVAGFILYFWLAVITELSKVHSKFEKPLHTHTNSHVNTFRHLRNMGNSCRAQRCYIGLELFRFLFVLKI